MTLNYGVGQVEILPNMAAFGPALRAGVAEAGAGAEATMGKSLGAVDQRVAQSSKGFSAWGSSIKTAAGFAGIAIGAEVIKGGLNAAEGLEKSTRRMQDALGQIQQPASMDQIQAWAKGFADQTGILRTDVLDVASKLAQMGEGFFEAVGPQAGQWVTTMTADLENMSVATGKSIGMLLRSLGPAILNTPEKAIPLLQKYGALTDDQAAKVKALTDAGNNQAATEAILVDLQGRYADVAAHSASPMDHLKQSMNEAGIVIGQVLVPVISTAAQGLQILGPALEIAGKDAGLLLGAVIGYKAAGFLPGLLQSIGLAANALGLESVAAGATTASTALAGMATGPFVVALAAAVALKLGLDALDRSLGEQTKAASAQGGAALDDFTAKLDAEAGKFHGWLGSILTFFVPGAKAISSSLDNSKKSLEDNARAQQRQIDSMGATNRATMEVTRSEDLLVGRMVEGAAATHQAGAAAEAAAWNEQHLAQMHHAVAQAAHAEWTAELELAGGLVGVETAAAQARDGQKKLQDLAAAGKTGTKEYSQALADQQGNVLALAGAVQTYEDQQKQSPAAAAAALGALEALGSKYGLTKDQIDRMAASGLHAKSVIDSIAAGVNGLHDKTITITVQQRGDTSLHGGGGLAAGGPVNAGVPYMVGERGPEYFIPDRSGSVLPHGQSPAAVAVHSVGMSPVPTHSHIIEGRVRMEDSGEMFFRLLAQDVVVSELAHRGL